VSFQKIVKAAKIVKAGTKWVKVHQGASGVNCSDGDQELSLWLDTEGESLPAITWDNLELFELEAKLGYNLMEVELVGDLVSADAPGHFAVSAQEWESVVWVALATDQESTRYCLSAVFFEGQGVVATDGRRLHRAGLVADFGGEDKYPQQLVPVRAVKAVSALIKLFKDRSVLVSFTGTTVTVSGERWRFKSRLVEGRFPNWRQVCPHLTERSYLRETTIFAAALADAKAAVVRHKLEIKAKVRTDDAPIWQEILPACDNGAACLINPKYLVDGLALLGKSKSIRATVEESRDAVLTIYGDAGTFAVIMPGGTKETNKDKAARLAKERAAAGAE
jgi:hypothetical protein